MSNPSKPLAVTAALIAVLLAKPALAYIGPGAGITMLSALWGVVVAIALALAAVLFWPIRALLRRRRKPEPQPTVGTTVNPSVGERTAGEPRP